MTRLGEINLFFFILFLILFPLVSSGLGLGSYIPTTPVLFCYVPTDFENLHLPVAAVETASVSWEKVCDLLRHHFVMQTLHWSLTVDQQWVNALLFLTWSFLCMRFVLVTGQEESIWFRKTRSDNTENCLSGHHSLQPVLERTVSQTQESKKLATKKPGA